jgi:hypothetical protein
MSFKLSDILVGILFIGLIIGSGFIQTDLKKDAHLFTLCFGLMAFISLFSKPPFKSSLPFYMLLGLMIYFNILIFTGPIVNILNPDDGWVVDKSGERHRIMQMNWAWGALIGLIISPLTILFYHKFIRRNKYLEILFTATFVVVTGITYIKYQLF